VSTPTAAIASTTVWVIVQIRDGATARWREYQTESALPWNAFVGASRFA
jgi:hypothetical protein